MNNYTRYIEYLNKIKASKTGYVIFSTQTEHCLTELCLGAYMYGLSNQQEVTL